MNCVAACVWGLAMSDTNFEFDVTTSPHWFEATNSGLQHVVDMLVYMWHHPATPDNEKPEIATALLAAYSGTIAINATIEKLERDLNTARADAARQTSEAQQARYDMDYYQRKWNGEESA